MQIVIDIPEKEFGIEIADKFQDFFKRLEVETKEHMISGTNLLCGTYELETIQMLMQALANGTPLPNTLEYLEMVYTGARACDDVEEQVRLARAIAAYKQDVHEDCTVLDKVRAEIETEKNAGCHTWYAGGLDFAMSIIDKYKAEMYKNGIDIIDDDIRQMMKDGIIISRNLCDSCINNSCIFQSGIVRNHCDFYKAESEG